MMLDVQGLRTGYGRIPILNGVSFAVNEGEFVGILGHNGMGKTTLLKALMGFLPATGGRVLFDGDDVTAARTLSPRAAGARLCAAGPRDLSRAHASTTICAWAAPSRRQPSTTPSQPCWRSFRA